MAKFLKWRWAISHATYTTLSNLHEKGYRIKKLLPSNVNIILHHSTFAFNQTLFVQCKTFTANILLRGNKSKTIQPVDTILLFMEIILLPSPACDCNIISHANKPPTKVQHRMFAYFILFQEILFYDSISGQVDWCFVFKYFVFQHQFLRRYQNRNDFEEKSLKCEIKESHNRACVSC